MHDIDFLLWKENIEKEISLNKDAIRHLITNFSLAYNVDCFNFLMGTPERTAAGINYPHDLFVNSLLLKPEYNYDIWTKVSYGKLEPKRKIKLGFDPIFTYPWGEDRISECLLNIGTEENKFEFSPNHNGVIVFPFDICVVTGGNHSIMTGIFKKDGIIEIDKYCDYSNVLNDIDFIGEYFYFRNNTKKIIKPSSEILGLIYYLGKFLV